MNQQLKRLLFSWKITAGIPSFVRLLWHSKKLRWSKTGFLKANLSAAPAIIEIKWPLQNRKLLLRTYDGDIDIFFEIFFNNIYRLPGVNPASIKTIVDLGSNVGLSVVYFLRQYPGASVICVEPEPSNFVQLSKNLLPEITSGKVMAIEAAVTGKDGNVSFEPATVKYNSRIGEGSLAKNTKGICINTLLDQFGISHINLLKMDVEGAEAAIFSANVDWLRKVDNIIIELHGTEAYTICMLALEQHAFVVSPISTVPGNENLYWARSNTDGADAISL